MLVQLWPKNNLAYFEDREILAAIANHKLGSPAMNQLSYLVFLADTLETTRDETPKLEYLRN